MKPIVHYKPTKYDNIQINQSAFIFPINHPYCSNTTYVRTSRVVHLQEIDGKISKFETLNTIYIPRTENVHTT